MDITNTAEKITAERRFWEECLGWSCWVTYIELKGLHGGPVGPWDRCEESQHLLDDAVEILEADYGVQPQLWLGAQAAVVQETPGSQLIP